MTEQHQSSVSLHVHNRGAVRHKLFEPVLMRIDGIPIRAHLLDLSRSGALAHAEAPPLPGARAAIEGIGLLVPARIVWVRAKRFGLQFDQMVPQSMVDMLIGAV